MEPAGGLTSTRFIDASRSPRNRPLERIEAELAAEATLILATRCGAAL